MQPPGPSLGPGEARRSSPSQRGFAGLFLPLRRGLCWMTSDAPDPGALGPVACRRTCSGAWDPHHRLGSQPRDGAASFLSHTSPDLISQPQEWGWHRVPPSSLGEGVGVWVQQFYRKSAGFRARLTQAPPIMVLPSLEGQARHLSQCCSQCLPRGWLEYHARLGKAKHTMGTR